MGDRQTGATAIQESYALGPLHFGEYLLHVKKEGRAPYLPQLLSQLFRKHRLDDPIGTYER
jgi:hypothetical protein